MSSIPDPMRLIARAREHARRLSFEFSSHSETAPLLNVLAASVAPRGRILELGTGVGVGTAALVTGLAGRRDVELVTIDFDERLLAAALDNEWPPFVTFRLGEVIELLPTLGLFDLVFADALQADADDYMVGLERSIDAVAPTGLLLIDDMKPQSWWTAEHAANKQTIRTALAERPDVIACDMAWSSGLILCAKMRRAR